MSQATAAELCTLLVQDIYGEVSSKVVSILLERGRLPLLQICQYTALPQKTVKQTLVVLIQQHLVVHFTHNEGGNPVCYYDCNWTQAYQLLHAGRIIRTIEELFGNDGALIASNLLQLGHARVSDFLAAYGISTKKARKAKDSDPSAVIEADTPITSVETLKEVITNMLRERFLVEVKQHHVHTRTDIENGMRAELISKLHKNFSSELKLMKEVNAQMKIRLKEMEIGDVSENAGLKRKAAQPGGRSKKRKKVSIYDDEEEDVDWEVDENLVLRINHDKFLVVFRNAELVSLAEQRLGKVTAQVYAEFLSMIEPHIFRCKDNIGDEGVQEDEDKPLKKIKLSCRDLAKNFNKDIKLEGSIAVAPNESKSKTRKRSLDNSDDDKPRRNGSSKPNGKSRHNSDESEEESEEEEEEDEWAEVDEDMEPEALEKQKRIKLIKQHLLLLQEDSFKFLIGEGNRGMGEWSVNYKELGKTMRSIELEKIVEERFESTGTRLLRIIKDKGKLDEKQIANIALLKQNQIRAVLSGLHECGHIELQEVPKSIPPQATRTYFLWFFDEARANALLLSDVYKAMSRNIQRTMAEKEKRKHLIEKSERSDVKANYEEYMSKNEKKELDIWRSREERMLAQLMRLDRIVMIMRDY
ncbi:RNA polymerase III subunit RPC82-domain-containing protein [Tricharina praecox]|uniref:RNA polymerase III subunit RPC82-domain-containing protein n=1 Tax=Tricharina praecox TaxID=43433 RepID=UPI00221F7090|nr:RNA polymerase III subunit RPC82-domain-containing protein [Tricharina praecox]KAI5852298.1 RNA polymerase III subunit RPC82-domain-containing protein [Tricharina praecox]